MNIPATQRNDPPYLLIPVYLNQRIVFDLIAMLQDGISTVTRVASTEMARGEDQKRYGAAFGLSQALASLLRIELSGEATRAAETGSEIQRNEERVHTPASLFQKLRSVLIEKRLLRTVDSEFRPSPGDIVEFATSLKRNPLVQVMDTLIGLMDVAVTFEERGKKPVGKPNQSGDYKRLKQQIQGFSDAIKTGGTIDVMSDVLECGFRAVITLEEEYLNNPTMADLVEGSFRVVGKVIRVIPEGGGSLSLLRKAAVSAMSKETLQPVFSQLSSSLQAGGLQVPQIELEIPSPVIQIIPVAIFA